MSDSKTPYTSTFGLFTREVDAALNALRAAQAGKNEGAFEEAENRFADISSKVAGIRNLPEVEQVDATAKLLRDENLSSDVIARVIGVENPVIENILNQNNFDRRGNPIKEEFVDLNGDTTGSDLLKAGDLAAETDRLIGSSGDSTVTGGAGNDQINLSSSGSGSDARDPDAIINDAEKRGLTVEQILNENQGTSSDGDPYNIGEVLFSLIISKNPNARKILIRSGYVQPDADAVVNNQAAAEAAAARNQAGADAAAQRASDGNTDTGLKADNAAGGAGGSGAADNVPAAGGVLGGADTTVGGAGNDTLTGGGGNDTFSGGNGNDTINNDNNTDKDISVISGGSVLDQTGTGDVNVDDKPAGLLNIPISVPKQPERKAGMIMQISQSAPIVETVLDDYLYPPMFRELNNVKQSPFATALLFSNGLMGSFV